MPGVETLNFTGIDPVKEIQRAFSATGGPDVCIDCVGAWAGGWVRICGGALEGARPSLSRSRLLPRGLRRAPAADPAGFRFPTTLLHKVEQKLRLETDSPEVVNSCIHAVKKGGRIGLIGDVSATSTGDGRGRRPQRMGPQPSYPSVSFLSLTL